MVAADKKAPWGITNSEGEETAADKTPSSRNAVFMQMVLSKVKRGWPGRRERNEKRMQEKSCVNSKREVFQRH